MSLDVYLEGPSKAKRAGSGIFVRENGSQREITREEWDERNPGREPVTFRDDDEEDRTLYSSNITHNLSRMASEAGIYEALWNPAKMDPARAARIKEQEILGNYHGTGGAYEIEGEVTIYARDLIEPLFAGLKLLLSDRPRFEAMNPSNGWGDFDGLVAFVDGYMRACMEHPDAEVKVSR